MNLRVVVAFTEYDVDIIDVPKSIFDNINVIRRKFDKWVYNKDNVLSWDKKNKVFCFRADLFVFWLNTYVLTGEEKAELIESQPDEYDHNMPKLYF